MNNRECINIRNATENNLKSLSVSIPRNKLVVVTGVSGSGKSTLVFDVLYREAGNRYLGSFSSGARQFFGKLRRPEVEKIEGLTPALSVDQSAPRDNPRSTAGTMTGIYDYLRLLFARLGKTGSPADFEINRNLFSFNSPAGACPVCNGLGVEDYLDPELLVADATKSVRDRALVITAPNGYIIYSQVTMDVLDQLCRAEGFSVDIPWKDLTTEQKNIILYGSDKIEIPFGKHTLESRMKWTGITAKPRETGYYKGILPIMENILKRDRNRNILRFVRTIPCKVCHGKRLNSNALSVKLDGYTIHDLAGYEFAGLPEVLSTLRFTGAEKQVADPIISRIRNMVGTLNDLGLGYISCTRESGSLSGGEARRMRLAVQAGTGLTGLTYLFDEPSAGLHPSETLRLIRVLKNLRDKGNTVIVIEHEDEFLNQADWLIDIGPGAGVFGGELIYSGPADHLKDLPEEIVSRSRTISFYTGKEKISPEKKPVGEAEWLTVEGASANNLKNITVRLRLGCLNVIAGVSGAGKSSLSEDVLGKALRRMLNGSQDVPGKYEAIHNADKLSRVISIDQSPIGRTPRSNPATYTGLSDLVRDVFASLPQSKEMGFDRSHFSFNTEGGRCENCQGAGFIQTGMHFMGNVEIPCEVCEGKRFKDAVLQVKYKGMNIHEVYDLFISEALDFFSDQPKVLHYFRVMDELGLGYLKPGQRSTTLSGGEAQRIKLAAELARPVSKPVIYILDEPTTGLHQADVSNLLNALFRLTAAGHTVVVTEHHPAVIEAADHLVMLGPGSGKEGGYLIDPHLIRNVPAQGIIPETTFSAAPGEICLKDVTTNNLRNISVSIPVNKFTVVTGVSGSGKSSLAFDTLYAEGKNRFMESFSSYVRTRAGMEKGAEAGEISGLTAPLAVDQKSRHASVRSTVGTLTGIYDLYRLLYSRVGMSDISGTPVLSSLFSFNHQHGACQECDGLGILTVCDPARLITHPDKSILSGAMDGTRTGKFYGDPHGQYTATLKAAGDLHGIDLSQPWQELPEEAKKLVMDGTGEEMYDVTWEYRRGNRTGSHHFRGRWQGLLSLVNEEYSRKHADHRGEEMLPLMKQVACPSCGGSRLNPIALSFRIGKNNIAELSSLPIGANIQFFSEIEKHFENKDQELIASGIKKEILSGLKNLADLGLSYLQINRPLSTLSGGEFQRVRLAELIGSGMTGVTCIPDEPTLGLHPADTEKLIRLMHSLKNQGNTLVVVEHDRDVILSADHIIDMGPGAGKHGGMVVADGSPEEIMQNPESVTGKYLKKTPLLRQKPTKEPETYISISGASLNNLRNIDVRIPGSGITVISGVSGSGKSTLIFDVLFASWKNGRAIGCREVSGTDAFTSVVALRQKPSFTSTLATPVTFTGIFDKIRDLFASVPGAKAAKFTRNHFSFNGKEGRCPECEGTGIRKISMDFLPDVETICETCNGSRYRKDVLGIEYQGMNIGQVLQMTFSEMLDFFSGNKNLSSPLSLLEKTGLGYLVAGQSLESLSGGEARRLHLATELMKPARGKTLYLFEEPSSGLHFRDTEYLLNLFDELSSRGNALIIIEHDPEIILHADHVIDLGPGGGDAGGELVFAGTPEQLLTMPSSLTGKYLSRLFGTFSRPS